jgi:hypothetical protein
MSDCRNGEVEIVPGLAAETEITQESSQRGDQLLSRSSPTLARTIQQKLPNSLDSPPAYIFAKSVKQLSGATTIKPKCGFGRTAMSPKPIAESSHEDQLIVTVRGRTVRANTELDQISVKELYSKTCVVTRLSAVARLIAVATRKMSAKGLQGGRVDIAQCVALTLNKRAEVRGSAQIVPCNPRGISLLLQ